MTHRRAASPPERPGHLGLSAAAGRRSTGNPRPRPRRRIRRPGIRRNAARSRSPWSHGNGPDSGARVVVLRLHGRSWTSHEWTTQHAGRRFRRPAQLPDRRRSGRATPVAPVRAAPAPARRRVGPAAPARGRLRDARVTTPDRRAPRRRPPPRRQDARGRARRTVPADPAAHRAGHRRHRTRTPSTSTPGRTRPVASRSSAPTSRRTTRRRGRRPPGARGRPRRARRAARRPDGVTPDDDVVHVDGEPIPVEPYDPDAAAVPAGAARWPSWSRCSCWAAWSSGHRRRRPEAARR